MKPKYCPEVLFSQKIKVTSFFYLTIILLKNYHVKYMLSWKCKQIYIYIYIYIYIIYIYIYILYILYIYIIYILYYVYIINVLYISYIYIYLIYIRKNRVMTYRHRRGMSRHLCQTSMVRLFMKILNS